MKNQKTLKRYTGGFTLLTESDSPDRYRILRRKIIILMILVTIIPLTVMGVINQYEYQKSFNNETVNPLRSLASKAKHSFELFLEERLAIVKSISSLYSFEDFSNQRTLTRIFHVLINEYCCLVDLGLIDAEGIQVSYTGPYDLLGKDYSQQGWFKEVLVKGIYISDVFMGYRQFPHVAIAVLRRAEERAWVLRATIDTSKFDELISSMGLGSESDAFLINRKGILQTPSRFYGKVLDTYPLSFPRGNYGAIVVEEVDPQGRDILLTYAPFSKSDYVLVLAKLRSTFLRSWYVLRTRMIFIFIISVITITLVVFKLTDTVVKRVKEADERREFAFREIQHTHKLSSIGRLAAGVAHEINNPMAIINEKAGLMKDLVENDTQFPNNEKFMELIISILHSVERCKSITHRLLGFARHMDVQLEKLDLNDLVNETLGFLENEALFRNIELRLSLAKDLPLISSDRGQLQQVFLNILSNAFAAVEDMGQISIRSWEEDSGTVAVSIQDDGVGMSPETIKHIFEPFFTTKKQHGTGLGLSITYGIVKKMGGDIKISSRKGYGTTFTVYLKKTAAFGSEE
jgi:two-component system NtrC family sensor kinase